MLFVACWTRLGLLVSTTSSMIPETSHIREMFSFRIPRRDVLLTFDRFVIWAQSFHNNMTCYSFAWMWVQPLCAKIKFDPEIMQRIDKESWGPFKKPRKGTFVEVVITALCECFYPGINKICDCKTICVPIAWIFAVTQLDSNMAWDLRRESPHAPSPLSERKHTVCRVASWAALPHDCLSIRENCSLWLWLRFWLFLVWEYLMMVQVQNRIQTFWVTIFCQDMGGWSFNPPCVKSMGNWCPKPNWA